MKKKNHVKRKLLLKDSRRKRKYMLCEEIFAVAL